MRFGKQNESRGGLVRVLGRTIAVAMGGWLADAVMADYAGTVLGWQPAAYWRLNEVTPIAPGNRAWNGGSLGRDLDGFYNGNALHPVRGALAGSNDGAAAFDGTGGTWISIANLPGAQPEAAFTIECWVQPNVSVPNDDSSTCPVASLQRGSAAANGWVVYQMASGWNFRMGNAGGYLVSLTSRTLPQPGRWHHLAAVFTGERAKLFVNGAEEAAGVVLGTYAPNLTVPLSIGARGDNEFRYSGLVDEVALYPSALAPSDLQAHVANGLSPTPFPSYAQLVQQRSPLLYYRLNEPPYTPVTAPVARNLGTYGTALDGRYQPGMTNGVAGPRPAQFYGFSADNRAAEFCGAGGYVSTPHQLNFLRGFTTVGWVRRGETHTGRGGFFGQQGIVEVGEVDDGTSIQVRIGACNASVQVPYPFAVREWGMLAVVGDGQQVAFYTNGVQAGVITGAVPDYGSSGAWFNIGGGVTGTPGDWFRGAVDEVAVFHRALSPSEVRSLYEAAGVAPRIIAQPQAPSSPVYTGNRVELSVAATGSSPLSYQWRRAGVALPGKTQPNLVFNPARTDDSGSYDVLVRNNFGAVTSVAVQLTVQPASPPIIVTSPQSHTRFVGGQVTFSVDATGSFPLTYQWQFNGKNVAGQTGASLTLANLKAAADGSYQVLVKNAFAPQGVTSEVARLTIVTPPRYAAAVLADGPMAYWRLGETNEIVANDAWGGYDGRYAQVVLGQSGYSAGDPDPAAEFAPERDARVAIDDGAAFNFQGSAVSFTIEAWVRFRCVSGAQRICSNQAFAMATAGGYAFGLDGSQRLNFNAYGDLEIVSPPIEPPLLAGKWYHLAVVVENAQITFYVNGRALGPAYRLLNGITSSEAPFQLGRNPTSSMPPEALDGVLDEVAVFSRPLSASRLQAHFDARDDGRLPPVFTVQPTPVQAYSGRPVTFVAVAEGSAPIRYQWLVNLAPLAGATNEPLTSSAPPGTYTITSLAANAMGGTRSTNVTLEVKAPPAECDLHERLVLHLRFDGNLLDSSGRRNDGMAVGSPGFVAGKVGSAGLSYRTDANAIPKVFDYVTLGRPPDLRFGTEVNFSVGFWVKFSGLPGNLPWLADNLNSSGDVGFSLSPSPGAGGWAWTLNDVREPKLWGGIGAFDPAINTLNDSHWHHLMFTFDRAGDAVTYVDGQPVNATSLRPAIGWDVSTSHPVNVGQAGGSYAASGQFQVDDFGVWQRALTPFEVDTVYLVGQQWGRSFAPDQATQIVLDIRRFGQLVSLTWNGPGRLQSAARIQGAWTTLTNAVSPHPVQPTLGQQFYRVRQ